MVQALLHCMDMVRASQPGAPFLPLLAPNNRLETVKICGFNFQDHKQLNTHALSLQTSGGGPRRERCLCRSSPACQQQSRYRSRWPP